MSSAVGILHGLQRARGAPPRKGGDSAERRGAGPACQGPTQAKYRLCSPRCPTQVAKWGKILGTFLTHVRHRGTRAASAAAEGQRNRGTSLTGSCVQRSPIIGCCTSRRASVG